MRFMMIVKANEDSEAGKMPGEELLAEMAEYNEKLAKAGVLRYAAGLHPSSKGVRVRFSKGTTTVLDGPFAETKELIAGFWIIEVNSKKEAVEWAQQIPAGFGPAASEIEIRQFFGMEDFTPGPAIEKARDLEKELDRQKH